jgi:hypothetical protein
MNATTIGRATRIEPRFFIEILIALMVAAKA